MEDLLTCILSVYEILFSGHGQRGGLF